MARRPGDQDGCIVAEGGRVLGKDLQQQVKEESPSGKYRIRKKSCCIRKGLLSLIVLGVIKGLSLHHIRIPCIYVFGKQEIINLIYLPILSL